MTTLFHLVRHADHGDVGRVLTGRRPGVALTEAGRNKARNLARRLMPARPDRVLASPRLRARQTAAFIAEAAGREVEISVCLDEIDFGRWSGATFDALELDPDWQRWNAERDSACTPAGESMEDVATRFLALVDRLRRERPAGSFCLVSHSDVIKAGICRCLGRPYREVHDFGIAPASVTTLAIDDGGTTVLALNAEGPAKCEEPAH